MLKLIYLLSFIFSTSILGSTDGLIKMEYEVKDKFTEGLTIKHTNFIVETKEQFDEAMKIIKEMSQNKKLDYVVRSLHKDSGFSEASDIKNVPFKKNSLKPVALGLGSEVLGSNVIDIDVDRTGFPTNITRAPSSNGTQESKKWNDPIELGKWYSKKGRLNLAFARGFLNGGVSWGGLLISGMSWHAAFFTSAVLGSMSGTLNWFNDAFSDLIGSAKYEKKLLDILAKRYPFFDKLKKNNSGANLPKFFKKTGSFTYFNLKWLISDFIFIKIIMSAGYALDAMGVVHGYSNFFDQLNAAGVTALKGLGSQGLFDLSVAHDFSDRVTSFDNAVKKVEEVIEIEGNDRVFTREEALNLLGKSDIRESTFLRYKKDISKIPILSAQVLLERIKIHRGTIQLYRVGFTMAGSAAWAFASILDLVGINLGNKVFIGLMSAGAFNYLRLAVKKPKLIKNCSNYLD